ncbi:MAG: hypothetical protein ACK42Y_04405 [Candidatus Thermochlorobacter sp.]
MNKSKEMVQSPEAALAELEQVVRHLASENLALRLEKEALKRQLNEQQRALQAATSLASLASLPETSQAPSADSGALILSAMERLYFKERLQRLLELVDLELLRLDG